MLVSVVVSTQTAVLTFDGGGGHNIDKIAVENNPYFQEGVDVVRAAPFGYPVKKWPHFEHPRYGLLLSKVYKAVHAKAHHQVLWVLK